MATRPRRAAKRSAKALAAEAVSDEDEAEAEDDSEPVVKQGDKEAELEDGEDDEPVAPVKKGRKAVAANTLKPKTTVSAPAVAKIMRNERASTETR